MAHPKRQHSKQRSRKRRTHDSLTVAASDYSLTGNKMGFQHGVDPITGMYKGRQIVDVTPKKKKKEQA